MTATDIVILICSALGFLISLYFALVYYRLMKPDAIVLPTFCRMDERTCQSLLSTRNARILGAPNFLYGLVYYVLLILFISDLLGVKSMVSLPAITFASLVTVVLGVYLVYGLIVTLKTRCILCYTSHVCNLLILASLIAKRLE